MIIIKRNAEEGKCSHNKNTIEQTKLNDNTKLSLEILMQIFSDTQIKCNIQQQQQQILYFYNNKYENIAMQPGKRYV